MKSQSIRAYRASTSSFISMKAGFSGYWRVNRFFFDQAAIAGSTKIILNNKDNSGGRFDENIFRK
jgi:hypothetical protein